MYMYTTTIETNEKDESGKTKIMNSEMRKKIKARIEEKMKTAKTKEMLISRLKHIWEKSTYSLVIQPSMYSNV